MKTVYESKRGCGYRKQGGIYLFSNGIGYHCGKLPIALTVCPCCNNGIKFSRGFQWIKWELLGTSQCPNDKDGLGCFCPLDRVKEDRLGLMWVGERHYPTPEDFMNEGETLGVSKRIHNVPKDFKLGETWIALAHKKAIKNEDGTFSPGIFQLFKPSEVQYVCRGDETDEELQSLEKRGITPIEIKYTQEVDEQAFLELNQV